MWTKGQEAYTVITSEINLILAQKRPHAARGYYIGWPDCRPHALDLLLLGVSTVKCLCHCCSGSFSKTLSETLTQKLYSPAISSHVFSYESSSSHVRNIYWYLLCHWWCKEQSQLKVQVHQHFVT